MPEQCVGKAISEKKEIDVKVDGLVSATRSTVNNAERVCEIVGIPPEPVRCGGACESASVFDRLDTAVDDLGYIENKIQRILDTL